MIVPSVVAAYPVADVVGGGFWHDSSACVGAKSMVRHAQHACNYC